VIVPYFKVYPRICIEGPKKTMKNPQSEQSVSLDFGSKLVPSKCKAQQHSVTVMGTEVCGSKCLYEFHLFARNSLQQSVTKKISALRKGG
jgi:hypothetical protein